MNIFFTTFYSQDHMGQAQGTKEAAPVSLSCHTLDIGALMCNFSY